MPQPGLTTPPSARASTSPLNTSGGSAPQILTNGSPPPLQQQNSMPMGMGGGMSFGPPHAQMRNFGPPPDNFFQGPMAMHGPPPGMNMSMHGPMSPHLGMNANLLGGPPRMMQMHGPGGNMHMMTRMGMMPKIYPPNQHHITNPSNPNSAPIAICGKCHEETHDTDGCILCESGCNFFYHRACVGLTEQALHFLNNEKYAEWCCDNCQLNKQVPPVKLKS